MSRKKSQQNDNEEVPWKRSVKELRRRYRLTQPMCAVGAGVDTRTWWTYEHDEALGRRNLAMLAAGFGLTVADFLDDLNNVPPAARAEARSRDDLRRLIVHAARLFPPPHQSQPRAVQERWQSHLLRQIELIDDALNGGSPPPLDRQTLEMMQEIVSTELKKLEKNEPERTTD